MAAKLTKPQQKPKGIYVVTGKDDYLVGVECEKLVDALLPAEARPMCLYQPRIEDVKAADVFDELRTLPFLAERRVVVLRDADDFISANRELLERYFVQPSGTGVLILTVKSWRGNTRLAKLLDTAGTLITVAHIPPGRMSAYAADFCGERFGKSMSRQTAGVLVELVGDEPGRVCSEVEKLAMYVGSAGSITTADVEKLIGCNRAFNAFGVIDSLMAGNCGAAVGRLRRMFAGNKEAEYTVIGAFAYHFRRMFEARKLLAEGVSQKNICQRLGIWESRADDFFRVLSRVSLRQVCEVLRELACIDYSVKTGQERTEVAMERLVVKLAGDFV